jgi:DNA-binding response OmpR family regulator
MTSKRILFLEDEEELVADMPSVMGRFGFQIDATADINEALSWFNTRQYDAVLLDIAMQPTNDMDAAALGWGRETGVEVARRMHKSKSHVPLIALTVIRDDQIRSRMREAGICKIINKPAEVQQIADELRSVNR